jgi:membrane protein implicated in regulation of membrane protease activity
MVAVEAITAEATVYAAANGKVAASGTIRVGRAANAASADGDLILVDRSVTVASPADLSETVSATNVLTAQESGKTLFLSSATEFVTTLPAPAAGLEFSFVVAAAPSGASYTIVSASSANIILGHVVSSQDAGGNGDSETSGGDTISLVDAKAVVGDRVDVVSDGTSWFARCSCKTFDAITITTAS